MIRVRKSAERGHFDHDWLDTYHTFSFDQYYDPEHMQFRSLRVINEDRVAPGAGFPTHGHRDMEIITYVLEGELEHKDSMGNGTVIRPGEVQRMTAGKGVRHSEFNHSKKDPVHLLQIWILPEKKELEPGYEQKDFSEHLKQPGLHLVASPDGEGDSVTVHQDARVYAGKLPAGTAEKLPLEKDRHAWVQVARGEVLVNGTRLGPSDAAAVSGERSLELSAKKDSEILLFDLA